MFNNLFSILTTASDISQFISLKKAFDNHDQLQIIQRLDRQDDTLFSSLLSNQNIIIGLLGEIMMDIKIMMDKIVDHGSKEDMDTLGSMFVDMAQSLKYSDREHYDSIKYKLYTMAYGDHLTEDLATKWVSKMQNKDGTSGEHWTYEQTEQVRRQYAPEQHGCDFYAVLNMMYSDYYDAKFDTTTYVNLAKDWLGDKDVGKGKTLKYYMFVVC